MELSESTVFYIIHYRILRKAKVKLHQNLRALDSNARESFPTQSEIISISNCAQQGLKSLRTERILRPCKNGAVVKKTNNLINHRIQWVQWEFWIIWFYDSMPRLSVVFRVYKHGKLNIYWTSAVYLRKLLPPYCELASVILNNMLTWIKPVNFDVATQIPFLG